MTLPDAVQRQLVRWAAQALGDLPADRVPATLRPVARFRPNRRATLGSVALTTALDSDAGFRAAVAEFARSLDIDPAGAGDVVERAAAAHLWDHPAAPDLADQVGAGDPAELRREIGRLQQEVARLQRTPRPVAVGAPARTATPAVAGPPSDQDPVDRLRQRLREMGTQLRAARDAAAGAEQQATAELKALRVVHDRAQAELRNVRERLEQEQARADRAQEQLAVLRDGERSAKEAAHRRIELLLETVEQAGQGLRREWQLTAGGPDPADRVAASLAAPAAPLTGDTATLNGLLALPRAHLIVDGYNVTKTGYPQLTLAAQRDRLTRELSALASRTSAEVTVVFDGATVVVPQARLRGVRVLYSPTGVTADDVIRQLVGAEPVGRVLLVVTADREIILSVIRAGARTVPPRVLLTAFDQDGRR